MNTVENTMKLPQKTPFAARASVEQVEEGLALAPKFDAAGLIPVVTTDYTSGEVLMLGYMNAEALSETLRRREAVYYSRSRQALWHKGKTSGFVQHVKELRIDDDQDTIWLRVNVRGASCHVGYRSCFYRSVLLETPEQEVPQLQFEEKEKVFDPAKVYPNTPNPTRL